MISRVFDVNCLATNETTLSYSDAMKIEDMIVMSTRMMVLGSEVAKPEIRLTTQTERLDTALASVFNRVSVRSLIVDSRFGSIKDRSCSILLKSVIR
ncbi:hypothetical protein SDC9_188976 [bioreactor metagenome]|uniref:Uncharacterized protein n=1 Tax=bioreactor metagenome TaxID=1076179 RepID=A0A645HRD6_9ZZZZ